MNTSDLSRSGLLAIVRQVYETRDPMPADLVERMQAVVAGEAALVDSEIDYELMLLVERTSEVIGARGSTTYTLHFTHDAVDLLLRTVPGGDGSHRLDGWLAPPLASAVRLVPVSDGGSWQVRAGDDGRFELADLPAGLYRLFLTPEDSAVAPFSTPAFEI